MFRRFLLSILVFFSLSLLFAQNQPPTGTPQAQESAELQSLKSDSQRMRVLLNQMRSNLAFVDTTQSPLKHQFEIEADMWQVMLDQMDRKIVELESEQNRRK